LEDDARQFQMKLQATQILLSRANSELDDSRTQIKTLKAQIEQLRKNNQAQVQGVDSKENTHKVLDTNT
jgi:capsule polysaccharide export protein KpsE/RkpR